MGVGYGRSEVVGGAARRVHEKHINEVIRDVEVTKGVG